MWKFQRSYSGPVKGVIFDWAGTTVDHGSRAPVGVFVEVFRRRGVNVTFDQARRPMGTHKREHFRQMTEMPEIAAEWKAVHGGLPTPADVDAMYQEGGVIQVACLPDFSDPIPGAIETLSALRERGIRVGSTTGYNREMLDVLVACAADKGFRPDCAVAASEVPEGRPAPFLPWTAAQRIGVWPASACVNVGDTLVDIESGLNAGMWSVGIAVTGNEIGLSQSDWEALAPKEQHTLRTKAYERLYRTGAHYVIDSVAELPRIVEEIEHRMRQGERP